MNDGMNTTSKFVITRTGLFYHLPGCRKIRGAKVEPYDELEVNHVLRYSPAAKVEIVVKPCRVCRPEPEVTVEDVQDDAVFERLMWRMLGAGR